MVQNYLPAGNLYAAATDWPISAASAGAILVQLAYRHILAGIKLFDVSSISKPLAGLQNKIAAIFTSDCELFRSPPTIGFGGNPKVGRLQ